MHISVLSQFMWENYTPSQIVHLQIDCFVCSKTCANLWKLQYFLSQFKANEMIWESLRIIGVLSLIFVFQSEFDVARRATHNSGDEWPAGSGGRRSEEGEMAVQRRWPHRQPRHGLRGDERGQDGAGWPQVGQCARKENLSVGNQGRLLVRSDACLNFPNVALDLSIEWEGIFLIVDTLLWLSRKWEL